MNINNHLIIRTGEFTVFDMTTGIEYEYKQPYYDESEQEQHSPKLLAYSIIKDEGYAYPLAGGNYAVKIWQWLQIHAKGQHDLDNEINSVIPF